MPRHARIDAPGTLHHIICRGIERRKIFIDDRDRDDFVHRLSSILAQTSTTCCAWVLIPKHFQLSLRTGSTPISTVMKRLPTGYAGGGAIACDGTRGRRRCGRRADEGKGTKPALLLGEWLNISRPAVSMAVQRGQRLAAAQGWRLKDLI